MIQYWKKSGETGQVLGNYHEHSLATIFFSKLLFLLDASLCPCVPAEVKKKQENDASKCNVYA